MVAADPKITKVTPQKLKTWKQQGRQIAALTASDYSFARLLDEAGVDLILVGDSLTMVALGYETTLSVTLDEMIHHAKAVRRGVKRALLICDLPFLSYEDSKSQALQSAGRVLKETGAQAVKMEGGYPAMVEVVTHLVERGIPVMGHIGLTPQSIHSLGLKQQGQTAEARKRILDQAIALEQAGAFAILLEHIPSDLALEITQALNIATIGIGAGPNCDGQILVTHDLLGISDRQPPFAKVYADLRRTIMQATQEFCKNVREHRFSIE